MDKNIVLASLILMDLLKGSRSDIRVADFYADCVSHLVNLGMNPSMAGEIILYITQKHTELVKQIAGGK